MQKDFLQSLKLEISKHISLNPYERMCFHRILGNMKSEQGMKILLRDLKRSSIIKKSALRILKEFNYEQVSEALIFYLNDEKTDEIEIFLILEHLEKFGDEQCIDSLKQFIDSNITDIDKTEVVERAVYVLGIISGDNADIEQYLRGIALNQEQLVKIRASVIESLRNCSDMHFYETLVEEKNNPISYAVYRNLSYIADREMKKYEAKNTDDMFTALPGEDDKLLLDIRVMLGKMSVNFDEYSNEAKTAFILAMITCGHREFIIYTMKALTSNDSELIDMTLYLILANVGKIRYPDKLFRNMISLPSITQNDDRIIVEIFVQFFKEFKVTRSSALVKDKIYNYIIVMLDTYFENYRKNYMIPEIMEKDYPENFQKIRRLILDKFNPEIKRRIISYLSDDEIELKNLLLEISEKSNYDESDREDLDALIEVLYDKDEKAREIAVTRINDIDFEKRYLRKRIIRLCEIIGRLEIDASSNLVKIFNYVKKYRDDELYSSVTYTLSLLNYPYMLGELEVAILSGDDEEKLHAVGLLSLYSEHRSVNIMLDYLAANAESKNEIMPRMLSILVKRDIKQNKAANEIAKQVFEKNSDPTIRKGAMHLLGKTGYEDDIPYLNEVFFQTDDNIVKEGIVQAYDFIQKANPDMNSKEIIINLKNYLKDPGIKVRMYACTTLLQMGVKDALTSLRDMMVIKNRRIQRDILTLLGSFINIEIAYFLISLLNEEYAISADIIPILNYLEISDKQEIDHFIVNLFKKFEGSDYGVSFGASVENSNSYYDKSLMKHFKEKDFVVFIMQIKDFENILTQHRSSDLSMIYKKLYSDINSIIEENTGVMNRTSGGFFISYYENFLHAAKAMLEVHRRIDFFNRSQPDDRQINLYYYLKNEKTLVVNHEILTIPQIEFNLVKSSHLENTLVIEQETAENLVKMYQCDSLPDSAFDMRGYNYRFMQLKYFLSFMNDADEIIFSIKKAEEKRRELEKQLEETIDNNIRPRSKDAVAYARAMDDIGRMLKRELGEINKYVNKRSTDRELIRNVERQLTNIYKMYNLETSKYIIE